MPKKVMKKGLCLVFVFVLMFSFVLAAEGWDSFENNNTGDNESVQYEEPNNNAILNDSDFDGSSGSGAWADSSLDLPEGYNKNFYYAILVVVAFLLILLAFLYFFLRGPKNRWKE